MSFAQNANGEAWRDVVFAGRLPVDLLNEIHRFKGSNTYHLERALRLYVRVMKETV